MRGKEFRAFLRLNKALHSGLHFFKGADFDLPYALARDAELLADLLERRRLTTAETEPQRDHVSLALRELGNGPADGFARPAFARRVLAAR